MITLLLFFAKAKSVISGFFSFALTHWRIILPVAIVCIGLLKYNAAINRADDAEKAYRGLQTAIQVERTKREAENKLNAILAQKKTAAANLLFEQKLKLANLDREKIKKDLLNEKANINRILANARKLQNNDTTATHGLPIVSVPTDLFAERSDYNAIVTLEEACQVTTQDYNELMQSWIGFCEIYGCEHVSR